MGGTQPSERALGAVARRRAALGGAASVEVVDVQEKPEVAERERILATPLLVRVAPPPTRRIAGDLSDTDRVLWNLGLEGGST